MKLSKIMFLSLLLLFIFLIQTEAERKAFIEAIQIRPEETTFIKENDHVFSNYIHSYNSSRSNK